MRKTIENLFGILRETFVGNKSERLYWSNEEIKDVFSLAKKHDIAPIVANCFLFKRDIDSNLKQIFQKEIYTAIYRVEGIEHELCRIKEVLEKEGVPFVILKGAVMRAYYPESWMRTSCDIDILLPADKLKEITRVISKELQYRIDDIEPHSTSLFAENGVHLELHDLIEVTGNVAKVVNHVWDNVLPIEGKAECVFSNEMFYFYHLAHMAKHIKHGGCGLRPFIDVYLIEKNMSINIKRLNSMLEISKMKNFKVAVDRLLEMWFNNKQDDEMLIAQEFILTGGVYGKLEQKIANDKIGQQHYLWGRIFVPYDTLKERYPILIKHKLLTPFYQIRRWFSCLLPKNIQRLKKEYKKSKIVLDEDVEKSRKSLTLLGLYDS